MIPIPGPRDPRNPPKFASLKMHTRPPPHSLAEAAAVGTAIPLSAAIIALAVASFLLSFFSLLEAGGMCAECALRK